MKTIIIYLITFISPIFVFSQSTTAETENGKKVVLYGDGTWEYAEDLQIVESAEDQRLLVKSNSNFFGVWINSDTWNIKNSKLNSESEFEFEHITKEAYGMVISDRIQIPLSSMKKIALENLKQSDPKAKIIEEGEKNINGNELLYLKIKANIDDMDFIYYSYYYSGAAGSIQLITFTLENLFEQYQNDFDSLLNGLVTFM